MLRRGEIAPDFVYGGRSLYDVLQQHSVVVFHNEFRMDAHAARACEAAARGDA